ncbi:MAG: ATP-binding cassette domain-containing protein [Terriglobales bacterium]
MTDALASPATKSPKQIVSGTLSLRILKRFDTNNPSFVLDVTTTIHPGITIIFGPSGAGKTTLLENIAGLLTPDSGRIAVGDQIFFDGKLSLDVRKRRIGYVFQDLALFPHLTVQRNVQYGIRSLATSAREQRTASILNSFRIANLSRRKPAEISGGERQRVALARSLVTDPCVLLLDEPLAALDGPTKSKIIEDLRMWNDAHRIPILYVTHSREEVLALGDRVLMIESGKIIAEGNPTEIM